MARQIPCDRVVLYLVKPFRGEKLILSNTVYLYSYCQSFAQAASRKACRAGEGHLVLVKNSPTKRLPNVSRYHILCLCQIRTQYVVINWVFLRV